MMKYLIASMLVVCASLLTSCTNMAGAGHNECINVDEVKSKSSSLAGKDVAVCGYLAYRFEDKNLYGSLADAKAQRNERCISVGYKEQASIALDKFDNMPVRLFGELVNDFCPPDSICPASCSNVGIFAKEIAAR